MVSYLGKMEVPSRVVDALISTGSNDILWVSDYGTWTEEEGGYSLYRAPSLSEWFKASCGALSRPELLEKLNLKGNYYDRVITAAGQARLTALEKAEEKIYDCEGRLLRSARKTLNWAR